MKTEAEARMTLGQRDDALFRAFVAGFEVSAEGFNGEYRHPDLYDSEDGSPFTDHIRALFENWRAA